MINNSELANLQAETIYDSILGSLPWYSAIDHIWNACVSLDNHCVLLCIDLSYFLQDFSKSGFVGIVLNWAYTYSKRLNLLSLQPSLYIRQ